MKDRIKEAIQSLRAMEAKAYAAEDYDAMTALADLRMLLEDVLSSMEGS